MTFTLESCPEALHPSTDPDEPDPSPQPIYLPPYLLNPASRISAWKVLVCKSLTVFHASWMEFLPPKSSYFRDKVINAHYFRQDLAQSARKLRSYQSAGSIVLPRSMLRVRQSTNGTLTTQWRRQHSNCISPAPRYWPT